MAKPPSRSSGAPRDARGSRSTRRGGVPDRSVRAGRHEPRAAKREDASDRRKGTLTKVDRPAGAAETAERAPRERKPYGDRPARGERPAYGERKPYGDRPARGERPAHGERKPYGDRQPRGERPAHGERKPYGDRPARGERPAYGERKPYGERPARGDRPAHGERKPYGERPARDDRPAYGERKPYADRQPRGERPAYGERKPYADRQPRGERPAYGERKPDSGRAPRGERPARAERPARGAGKPQDEHPAPARARAPLPDQPLGGTPHEIAEGGERIAKLLARAGVASRREVERLIAEGRVKNGEDTVETPATLLTSLKGITVDGKPVGRPEPARLWAFHKPSGLITAERDPAGRPTIYTALRNALPPGTPRLMPVGRLDLNTEGLLLLTNDGELKRAMELPSTGVPRTYRARTFGDISQAQLEELILGVTIDGVRYGRIDANLERRTGRNQWVELTLTEGKNREVRRVLEYLGLQVSRLMRVSYGPFLLADLPRGAAAPIRQQDVERFRKALIKAGPSADND